MEDWHKEAIELAAELRARGEVRISGADGEEYAFGADDLIALGLVVLCAGPDRTAEVVCSWLDRARAVAVRPMGDA
jgi:uncharacterized protein YjlB